MCRDIREDEKSRRHGCSGAGSPLLKNLLCQQVRSSESCSVQQMNRSVSDADAETTSTPHLGAW